MSEPRPFEFFGRTRELRLIDAFLDDGGSGFTHLRGRRRIGKTELLKLVRERRENCFLFTGREDESSRNNLKRFAKEWDEFTGEPRFSRIRSTELNWDEYFRDMGRNAALAPDGKPFILLLDEVQWLARRGSGFCGMIKEHWADWRKNGQFKLIISGSSNRFFLKNTDSDLATLRGLRTHATIWVRPFTLAEVRSNYFPRWSREQVCLIYMMLGGVPYYLENIRGTGNFIQTVNRSIFCGDTIFLEEVDAILRTEITREDAKQRAKELLATLGQDGATESSIVSKTGLGQDTVHRMLARLLDHGIVSERRPLGRPKKNRAGVRYYMADLYLNFYFQILEPLRSTIQGNRDRLIFSESVLSSSTGYYIPGFTGKAFELLLANLMDEGSTDETARTPAVFEKLGLGSGTYTSGTYWDHGGTQINLIIAHPGDREIRIVEAKWISRAPNTNDRFIDQVLEKVHHPRQPGDWTYSHHLVISRQGTKAFYEKAKRKGVRIIELADLS
jgi:AAA+ ATPase superfamily predicted ATPase